MTRPGVTYFDVANIAQQLIASGYEPTIERIRSQLKTGSNTTIGTHLRIWRSKRDTLQQLATKEKIPEELVILLKGLWERVMGQAEAQVDAIKNETRQDLEQQKQTIQQLQEKNARLQQSELQLKQSHDSLAQEKIVLEKIITDMKTEMAALQAKQNGLLNQLTEKQARIEELHKQNKQTQANLEHYRAASLEQLQLDQQRAEQQQRELAQTMQQLKMENESLRQQKIRLQQLHDQLQLTLTNIRADYCNIRQHTENMSTNLIEANKALAQKSESQQHWQSQHDKVYTKLEEQMKMTAALQAHNAVLSQQIVAIKKDSETIYEQNKVLAHDKWMLGQEKAQLFGQLKQWESMAKTG
jgi:Plasmid replication region DNA-binding N-term